MFIIAFTTILLAATTIFSYQIAFLNQILLLLISRLLLSLHPTPKQSSNRLLLIIISTLNLQLSVSQDHRRMQKHCKVSENVSKENGFKNACMDKTEVSNQLVVGLHPFCVNYFWLSRLFLPPNGQELCVLQDCCVHSSMVVSRRIIPRECKLSIPKRVYIREFFLILEF